MNQHRKLVAVLVCISMLLSLLFVPASAVTSTDQADALKAAGLFLGTTTGYNLTGLLTRDQGITLALRAQGMEPAVKSQTQAEIDVVMAKVSDAASIPGWAKPYVAFALKQNPPITTGVSVLSNGKAVFAPGQRMTGAQFITFLARAMGYPSTLDTALDIAISAKMLSATQIVRYANILALNREQAVDVLYSVVRNGEISGTNQKLIDKLVAQGIATTVSAIGLGYAPPVITPTPTPVATPVPTPEFTRLAVTDIQVPNTKQIRVVFNRDLLQDTVLASNFIVLENGLITRNVLVAIQPDKQSVMLTIDGNAAMSNFTTVDVTVKRAMKDTLGTTLDADYVKKGILVQDTKVPELVKVETLGKRLIRLVFDEPVWNGVNDQLTSTNFSVKSGSFTYVVMSAVADYQDRAILLHLGTDMITGPLSVTVNALGNQSGHVRDFISFMTPTRETTLSYSPIVAEATVAIESLNKTTRVVSVRFSRPVFGANVRLYQMVKGVEAYGSNLLTKTEAVASDLWQFTMPSTIPPGNVNFFLTNSSTAINQLTDLYGVAVTDKTLTYNNVADTTPPSVLSVANAGNVGFDILFSEELDVTAAQKEANFEIRTASGLLVPITDAVLLPDLQTVRVAASLTDLHVYTVKVLSMKDLAGNTMMPYTISKTMTDSSNPTVTSAYAVPASRKIYITFSEAMNVAELGMKDNYLVDRDGGIGEFQFMGDGDSVTVVDNQHIILTMASAITTPSVKMMAMHDLSGKKLGSGTSFEYTGESGNLLNIGPETVLLEKAELVARNMVLFTFNTRIASFEPANFLFRQDVDGANFTFPIQIQAIVSNGENDAGQTEMLVQIDRQLNTDATWNDNLLNEGVEVQVVPGGTFSASNAPISARTHSNALTLLDALGGAIAMDVFGNQVITWNDFDGNGKLDTVIVKYDEAVKESSLSVMSFQIAGYVVNGISIDADGIVTAGSLGDHALTSRYVVLNISKAGQVNDVGTKPVVTQLYPISDAAGNVIE